MSKRLIGEDGALFRGELGTEQIGDGTTLTIPANTLVQITSGLTANVGSAFEGLDAEYFYYSPILTPATELPVGTKWKVMTAFETLDLAGWNLDVSAEVIDVTVNRDRFRKSRNGKLSASGSVSVVFIKEVTDVADLGFMSSFYEIVDISATGVATLHPVNDQPYFMIGWLDNKDSQAGAHKLFTVFQCEFENFPLNVRMGEAQGFDANFHLVGDTDPVIYRVTNV